MNWKKILLLLGLIAGGLWYRDYVLSQRETAVPAVQETAEEQSVAAQYTFTAAENGQTAEELLNENADVEYTDYGDGGRFVSSIDGIAGDEGHYWAFYLNGEYSQTGVSQTILQEGDIITFTYEAIDPAQL
jgi:hypothetical protein